jgi:glycerol-3-phosphate dehydrogenase
VHIVFDRGTLPLGDALVMAGGDGRIVFAMPHGNSVIVGTTDTDFTGDPADVAALPDDVDYLVDFMRDFLVDSPGVANVLACYAGLRALTSTGAGGAPSSVSREQTILTSAAGLISVAGGKLTTHRAIAEKVIDLALRANGKAVGPSPTLTTPLPGARRIENHADTPHLPDLEANVWRILVDRYGSWAEIVARIANERPELAHPIAEGVPAIGAEILFAIRNEMACTLADFMIRRTSLNWRAPRQFAVAARRAAVIMGAEMGWDDRRIADEIANVDAARPYPVVTVTTGNL